MDHPGIRIKELRSQKSWSQAILADRVDVSQQLVGSWETGRTRPNDKHLAKLSKVFGVSIGSLAFGEGGQEDWEGPEVEAKNLDSSIQSDDNIISVPEYDIRLSAGGGYVVDEETIKDIWVFNKNYIQELRLSTASLVVAEVEGDSMEPKLFTGDRVMINQSDQDVNRPGIFAIWDTTALVVKRIEKIPASDPPKLRLISDNPNHSKYDVLAEDTRIIGRIVWFARRL